MSWTLKTIWSEGMFLRPQHFQQHDRYLESLIEERTEALRPYPWGVKTLEISQEALKLGKIDITRCQAILPDGTAIDIPNTDAAPGALEIGTRTRDEVVYLCLLQKRHGTLDVRRDESQEGETRYSADAGDVRDTSDASASTAPIELGKKNLRLLRDSDERADFACLGIAKVIEARNDKSVILDTNFIAPSLDCRDTPRLTGFITELQGLLKQRAEAIATRLGAEQGGSGEIGDFMLLQVINRYTPLFAHLSQLPRFHPESLYATCATLAGELSTFTSAGKLPPAFPTYDHEDLSASFEPLMTELRRSLTTVLDQTAINIPLKLKKGGIRKADIADRELLASAYFVLAVKANLPAEEIRTLIPQQAKIGSPNVIIDLIKLQIPGVAMNALPQVPREIPFHAGFQYFELDKRGDMWEQIVAAGSMALHAGGAFPGLDFELWAIKSRTK